MTTKGFVLQIDKESQKFSIEYAGVCDNQLLVEFTENLSNNYETVMSPQEYKTVLFCANELLQNMGFYSEEIFASGDETQAGIGKFYLDGNTNEINMTAENRITAENYEKVNERLASYNSMNQDELKALYKQKLREQSPEDSKGGGIGFIEIIRKSKNPVSVSLHQEGEDKIIKLQVKLMRQKSE